MKTLPEIIDTANKPNLIKEMMAKKQTAYRIDDDVKKELPKLAAKLDRSQNWIVNAFLKFCIGEAKKNKNFKNLL